jgi:hypothetical protein
MPLGISETSAIAPMIERGGEAISQDLTRLGQTIQASLIRQQAFRQARELGQHISQINPQSPDWPQQAALITSQYPLAVQSGLAEHILKPPAMAYQGYEAMRRVTASGANALERAKYIHSGAASPPMVNVGGGPQPSNPQPDLSNPTDDTTAPVAGILTGGAANIAPVVEEPQALPPLNENATIIPKGLSAYNSAVMEGRTGELGGMHGSLSDNAPSTPMDLAKQALAGAPGGQVTRKTLETVAARIAAAQATAANRAVKPEVATAWKPTTFGVFQRTDPKTGELQFKSFAELGIDAEKGMTKYQKEHLDEMRDRIKNSKISTQINSYERDLAKLHNSIETIQKDPNRRDELLPLQNELVAIKTKRDQLLETIGADTGILPTRKLDKETAGTLLKEAGGDADKARAMARERGYEF